eukprot:COSAG06_NODE_14494_length_1151_cov_10142.910646_2_plen_83_part_00
MMILAHVARARVAFLDQVFLVVVPALAQGQARAADVYHVIHVVRDLVGLAIVVAIVACHTNTLSTLVFKYVSCFVLYMPERI